MSEESKKILREKLSGENSVWFGKKHTEEEKKKMHDSSPLKKPVIQLDLNGKYLNEYSSYTYAAKAVNGKESSINLTEITVFSERFHKRDLNMVK